MPNTKSAKKRLRQNVARRAHNRSIKANVRTQVRKVREAVQSGDAAASEEKLRVAAKVLDKAASKRAIHPNLAARTKSRLSKAIKALKQPAP